jgi:hypothetical protein
MLAARFGPHTGSLRTESGCRKFGRNMHVPLRAASVYTRDGCGLVRNHLTTTEGELHNALMQMVVSCSLPRASSLSVGG